MAEKIATFHKGADVIGEKDTSGLFKLFEDLNSIQGFLQEAVGFSAAESIGQAIRKAGAVIDGLQERMQYRLVHGFARNVHGDLHTGNIFLLEDPQPFDCIEYNDDFRQIDLLDELAFLCMDLEFHDRPEFADAFLKRYLDHFPIMETHDDQRLFTLYKSYRANVRAKVIGLQAKKEKEPFKKKPLLVQCLKYLDLMDKYLMELF